MTVSCCCTRCVKEGWGCGSPVVRSLTARRSLQEVLAVVNFILYTGCFSMKMQSFTDILVSLTE